ncbi:MAG: GNAT family N-acetyltransferase [Candidatus Thorarchaeota archaeon]|nr:GNAT family N-acetyltransferase [Candidatus Thorarchaeota archaeon]
MIRQIKKDELKLIEPIMTKIGQESDSGLPPNFMEVVKTSVKEGRSFLYGAFSDDNSLDGIGLFGNVSKRLSFVYAGGNLDLEIKLIDIIFNNHSSDCPYIHAGGPLTTEAISHHLVKLGFRKLDRAYMTLSRKSVEAIDNSNLPDGMKLEVYDNSQIDELSEVVFNSNEGHIDQIVFPNFFGNVDNCKKLIENIENNVYGEYKKPYFWLLKEKGRLIGACLMTIRNKGDTGYIPDIVIVPNYRGKGLGKMLQTHSMKELLAGEPDIVKVDLDVTLENNARFLYKSLGYETVREYSMYTWIKQ